MQVTENEILEELRLLEYELRSLRTRVNAFIYKLTSSGTYGVQHSQADEGATGDGGAGHTS